MTPGKDGDDKDNPLHFSGEIKDWPTFKEAIQSRADARDTTWLLEAGWGLALFFARQIKDKTGSAATRKKALDGEKVKTANNHVPTSVDAYNDGALEEWFNDRDLATDLQLSFAWRQWGRISATTPSWGSKMQRPWKRHTRPST
jgi:hypothetical protein